MPCTMVGGITFVGLLAEIYPPSFVRVGSSGNLVIEAIWISFSLSLSLSVLVDRFLASRQMEKERSQSSITLESGHKVDLLEIILSAPLRAS